MDRVEPFEPMALHARKYKESGKILYRVYADQEQSKLVEAESAALAVASSGFEYVHRVHRENETILEHMPMEALEVADDPILTNIELRDEDSSEFVQIAISEIHNREEEGFSEMTWDAMHDKEQQGTDGTTT